MTAQEIETLSLALEVGGKVAGLVIAYLGAWWIAGQTQLHRKKAENIS